MSSIQTLVSPVRAELRHLVPEPKYLRLLPPTPRRRQLAGHVYPADGIHNLRATLDLDRRPQWAIQAGTTWDTRLQCQRDSVAGAGATVAGTILPEYS